MATDIIRRPARPSPWRNPADPRDRLPGAVRRRRRRPRRVSRPQHRRQPAPPEHRQRVRLSRPRGRLRHRRVADRLFAGRHLCPRLSRRPAQHALCRRARHRAGDDPRHRDGDRAAVAQLADRASWRRSMSRPSATSRCCCSCSSGGGCCAKARRRRARLGSRCPMSSSAIAASPSRCRSPTRPMAGWRWRCCVGVVATIGDLALGQAAAGARPEQQFPTGWVGLGLILGLPLDRLSRRRRAARPRPSRAEGLQLRRRHAVSPEFAALLIGLVVYTGTLYRRDRARRHPRGQLGPERGGDGARPASRVSGCGSSCCRRRCASSSRR